MTDPRNDAPGDDELEPQAEDDELEDDEDLEPEAEEVEPAPPMAEPEPAPGARRPTRPGRSEPGRAGRRPGSKPAVSVRGRSGFAIDPALRIRDRASTIFVIGSTLAFLGVFAYAMAFGKGGAFRSVRTPAPIVTPSPAPSATPAESPAPTESVSPAAS